MLVIVLLGTSYFVISALNSHNPTARRQYLNVQSLQRAKAALVAWSVARGSSAGNGRPGELPCPDTSPPGGVNEGLEVSPCAGGAIGRLPWRTLGIERTTDADGEPLWYSPDPAFLNAASNAGPINSDTRASRLVYSSDGTGVFTRPGEEAAAVIFAPGNLLPGQTRITSADQISATNYLESVIPPNVTQAASNSSPLGPNIQGPITGSDGTIILNDQLLVLHASELIAAAERRVAQQLQSDFRDALSHMHVLPFPAKFDDPGCTGQNPSITCQSNSAECRGRIPDGIVGSPWFSANHWGRAMYYAVGTSALASAPANCSATLTINGKPGFLAVIFTSGVPKSGQARNTPSERANLANYLEDIENQKGWSNTPAGVPNIDMYISPTWIANDKLYTIP